MSPTQCVFRVKMRFCFENCSSECIVHLRINKPFQHVNVHSNEEFAKLFLLHQSLASVRLFRIRSEANRQACVQGNTRHLQSPFLVISMFVASQKATSTQTEHRTLMQQWPHQPMIRKTSISPPRGVDLLPTLGER